MTGPRAIRVSSDGWGWWIENDQGEVAVWNEAEDGIYWMGWDLGVTGVWFPLGEHDAADALVHAINEGLLPVE